MKIAAVQMLSTPDVACNLEQAAARIAEAAEAGAELVALPEYFCLMGRRDDDKLAIAEAPGDGPIQRFLADQALQHGLPGLGRLPQAHLEFEGGLERALGLGTQPQPERGEAQSPQAF